jgi:serine/threonine-protein phosphatase 2B catalytic subunit
MCDLLWADPMKDEKASKGHYLQNQERDCSVYFGKKPCKKLLDNNGLMAVIRGHQVQVDGYKMHKWDGPQSFPYVITVFSAPNYCGYYENKASVLIIKQGDLSLKQYEETDPPYRLPDNLDIFTWSVPFLAQKVMSMLFHIVKKVGEQDDDEQEAEAATKIIAAETQQKRKNLFKAKLQGLTKMNKMFGVLTQERENILKIKNETHDGKLPRGLLMAGESAIKNTVKQFEQAQELDAKNEKRPPSKKNHFKQQD